MGDFLQTAIFRKTAGLYMLTSGSAPWVQASLSIATALSGAPDDTGGFSAIAGGEGDVNQGAQYLVTYSDYNNTDQTAGGSCGSSGCIINTSVFQERNIDAGDIGSVWALTFDAKSPLTGGISDAAIDNLDNYLEYPTSASAFIKTLDPSSGYNTTNDIRVDMTNISNTEWATFTISLDLSDPLLVGQILQFGFNTVTTEYDNSGVYYDNISFSRVAEIDVKPGSFPNSINVGSRGKIPVAILTTAYFDAGTVDVSSIQFGPGKAHPDHYALEDVDGDTDWDLILHFNTQEVGITCGDMEVSIAGQTLDAVAFLGADSINTVGCE